VNDLTKSFARINVRRPMQSHDGVVFTGNTQDLADVRTRRTFQKPQQRIDHDVADKNNALSRYAFGNQVMTGVF
jgi:hypothetical protein